MIDNYDSFVYNLVRYFEELGQDIELFRNDEITLEEAILGGYKGIIISPGPKTPKEAGVSLEMIKHFAGKVPILGICLGHQAIGEAFGAITVRGKEPVHGKTSEVIHDSMGLFSGISNPVRVTRYHSLMLESENFPDCFEITSRTNDGVIMGIRHKEYPVEGVQFHPEAELTEQGHDMLLNFVRQCDCYKSKQY